MDSWGERYTNLLCLTNVHLQQSTLCHVILSQGQFLPQSSALVPKFYHAYFPLVVVGISWGNLLKPDLGWTMALLTREGCLGILMTDNSSKDSSMNTQKSDFANKIGLGLKILVGQA